MTGLRLIAGLIWLAGTVPAAASLAPTRFSTDAEAQAAWTGYDEAPPVRASADGVVFPCSFDRSTDRFYWDCRRPLDLAGPAALRVELSIDRPAAVRTLSIYFKSGPGWYHWSRPLAASGRQTLLLTKAAFSTEGRPAGWDRIERVRISPWRGQAGAARITLHGITRRHDPVVILQAGGSAAGAANRALAQASARHVSRWLDAAGIPHGALPEDALDGGALDQVRLAILPYNPSLTGTALRILDEFLRGGGKLIVCGSASEPLARRMGLRLDPPVAAGRPGRWSAMHFRATGNEHLPERVYNTAWRVHPASPAAPGVEIIATWADSHGRETDLPACLTTPHGDWLTAVLRSGDPAGKQRLLTARIGRWAPETQPNAARRALASIGDVGEYASPAAAAEAIRRSTAPADRRKAVEQRLEAVETAHRLAARTFAAGAYPETLRHAAVARRRLVEAYALIQPGPPERELRAVWDHDGVGLYPGDWARTCRELAAAGINAIFPNLLWAGKAHVPSSVIPRSRTYTHYGDQAAQCLAGARQAGLAVHAWKVCWKLDNAPADLLNRLRREGRLQRAADGAVRTWLCPTHPENVRYELAGMEEFMRSYPVDGLHLDYIRFPDAETCFCPTCQAAFARRLGRDLPRWPQAVRDDPERAVWRQWRAERITEFVRAVRRSLRAVRPDAQLSAAVWRQHPQCRDSVGQDWPRWLEEGLVDFLCPMNYTTSAAAFAAETAEQLARPGAAGRIVPGIGVNATESQLTGDQVLDQIRRVRRLPAGGFILFDLSPALRDDVLPLLRLGAARPATP